MDMTYILSCRAATYQILSKYGCALHVLSCSALIASCSTSNLPFNQIEFHDKRSLIRKKNSGMFEWSIVYFNCIAINYVKPTYDLYNEYQKIGNDSKISNIQRIARFERLVMIKEQSIAPR